MAWTDPAGHVWVTGEVVTAANLNLYVRLNLEALRNDPAALVFNSAAISVPNAATTFLTFNSEHYDNDGIHSTVTNTGRLTCVTPSVYNIHAFAIFAAGAGASQLAVNVRLNGTTQIEAIEMPRNGAAATDIPLTFPWKLAAGDYLEMSVFQAVGAALNITPRFGMTRESIG